MLALCISRIHANSILLTHVTLRRFTNELDARKIPHSLSLFLDTDNAPASAVCASIFKVAEESEVCIIVMACHNKVGAPALVGGA